MSTSHPLDNPIWEALTTSQAPFAETYNLARRFHPDVTSLTGLPEPSEEAYQSLASLVSPGERAALLLEAPPKPPSGWTIIETVPLVQMVHDDPNKIAPSVLQFEELNERDAARMLALAELTKPGPFGRRTHEVGVYLGVYRDGDLVAMAGERLRLPGYTEISAICTHPEHSGRGYATALTSSLVSRIRDRNETPFLHVRPDNRRAVELYERLGFRERTVLHLAVLRK